MIYDYIAEQEVLAPLLRRYNPMARRLLGQYDVHGSGNWLRSRGRRVALLRNGRLTVNLMPAIVVLAADLGCPALRHFHGARAARQEVVAAATTLLTLGLVDSPEDDPDYRR